MSSGDELVRPVAGEDRPPVPVAPRVPGYEVLGLLGRGAMGVVSHARQKSLDRLVALKLLSADCARGLVWLGCFRRKGMTASALSHPNVCTVYDTGECGAGVELASRLRRNRRYTYLRDTIRPRLAASRQLDGPPSAGP
jgi:serine/threonine protein kinase